MKTSRGRVLNYPNQPRDPDGQFAGGSGGDAGDDDEFVGEVDEGDYGYGRDPNGKSYTEFDIDQDSGEPRFSQSYRDQYGAVVHDSGMGPNSEYAVAVTENGSLQIADDTGGTRQRQVLQDFARNPAGFKAVAEDIDDASRDPDSFRMQARTQAARVRVEPAGTTGDVRVTWKSGAVTVFDGHTAGDLGDASTWAPDMYRRETGGRAAHRTRILT